MTRHTPILHPDLLTRSDLAALQVPATDMFHWLAAGALEQVGELQTEAGDDPVFAVHDDTLRGDLAARLAAAARDDVLMESADVRDKLAQITASTPETLESADELAGAAGEVEAALREASDMATEAEFLLQQAAEAAALEALTADAAAGAADEDAGEQYFDLDALAQALDAFDGVAPEAAEQGPFADQEESSEPSAIDTETEQDDMDEATEAELQPEQRMDDHASIDELAELDGAEPTPDAELPHCVPTEPVEDRAASSAEASSPEPEPAPAHDLATSVENPQTGDASPPESTEIDDPLADEEIAPIGEEPPPGPIAQDPGLDPAASPESESETESAAELASEPDAEVGGAELESVLEGVAPGLHTEASIADVAHEPASNERGDFEATPAAAFDGRIADVLGELRDAVVELARRPAPSTIDFTPIVAAVQTELGRSAERGAETTVALQSLRETVAMVGTQVEAGLVKALTSLPTQAATTSTPEPQPASAVPMPRVVTLRPDRQGLVLGAVAVLVVCWSILFWIKTGSPRLALATLVGANLVGCCILLGRRDA